MPVPAPAPPQMTSSSRSPSPTPPPLPVPAPSDPTVITLDDDDDEDSPCPSRRSSANGKERKKSGLDRYLEDQISVPYRNESVSAYDYCTLEEEEYLNDAIINFHLTWLYHETLTEEQRQDVHIFSTHFYSKLRKYVDG